MHRRCMALDRTNICSQSKAKDCVHALLGSDPHRRVELRLALRSMHEGLHQPARMLRALARPVSDAPKKQCECCHSTMEVNELFEYNDTEKKDAEQPVFNVKNRC